MTRWSGWKTARGIVAAFESGRIQTRGDLSAVKNLLGQADSAQLQFVYDHIKEYLTPLGRREIFGRRLSRMVRP